MNKDITSIIVTTHGGVGNQLFQLFFGLYLGSINNVAIKIHHISLYKHGFKLSSELNKFHKTNILETFISNLRIPKISNRFFGGDEYILIQNKLYLDGYFQNADIYSYKNQQNILTCINHIRDLYNANSIEKKKKKLLHLRVPDYINKQSDIYNFFRSSLDETKDKIEEFDLITNRENELNKYIKDNKYYNVGIMSTANMNNYDLLRFMGSYQSIHGTTSTLAFWAAII